MNSAEAGVHALFQLGPFPITRTVVTTWGIMLVLVLLSVILTSRMKEEPARWQTALEGAMAAIEEAIAEVIPRNAVRHVYPFVATLWIYIIVSNLTGLIPEMEAPTRDLSTTAGLALVVFLSTHWFGIRSNGLRGYLKHYAEPSIILLPFHVISELTRTLALAIRLFGNIMSLEMAALLVLLIAGFLVPVPLLMLHVIEALVQAYIFGMLALIYIAGAIEHTESSPSSQTSSTQETS